MQPEAKSGNHVFNAKRHLPQPGGGNPHERLFDWNETKPVI